MTQRDRLGRLLFIVPYVAQREGVPVQELAQLWVYAQGNLKPTSACSRWSASRRLRQTT